MPNDNQCTGYSSWIRGDLADLAMVDFLGGETFEDKLYTARAYEWKGSAYLYPWSAHVE